MKRAAWFLAVLAAVACVAATPVLAQEQDETETGIPAYAVARLKVLVGSVWVRTTSDGDWEEFSTNSPVPPGSRLSVPAQSEGELQFHGGQFVLLTSGTDIEVRELKESRSILRIRAGEIRFDLPPDDFAPVTVRVPGGSRVQIPGPGKYWVVMDENQQTRLVVRAGEAAVVRDDGEYRVRGGEQAVIGQTVTVSPYGKAEEYAPSPPPAESESDVRVPPSVSYELRDYGEWVVAPYYGYVWRPYVAAGWTPYVYGRWAWISPYGWTWVSNEPWGWYPYRCGYWVSVASFGWCWYPYNAFVSVGFGIGYGTPWRPYYGYGGYRYYYRSARYYPANVRFVPEGRQVRWVPLQPGDRYRPSGVPRGDVTLSRWNRPLDSGRVYVRTGADRKSTRDYTAVRAEQQAQLRQTLPQRTRTDTRTVRPEGMQDGRSPAGPVNKGAADTRTRGTDTRQHRSAPSANGKTQSPPKGTYLPRDTVPERGQVEREAKPPRVAPGAPSTTVIRPPREPIEPMPRVTVPAQPKVHEPLQAAPAQPQPRVRESVQPAPALREEKSVVLPDAPDYGHGGSGRGGSGVERAPAGRAPDTGYGGGSPGYGGGTGGGRGGGGGGGGGGRPR